MGYFPKRRRKLVSRFALALWLFAIFVSVAHACGLVQEFEHASQSSAMHVGVLDKSDDGASPACQKFCADDFPLLGKLKAAQDPPTGHTVLTSAVAGDLLHVGTASASSPTLHPVPPPVVAVNTRFVRLTL